MPPPLPVAQTHYVRTRNALTPLRRAACALLCALSSALCPAPPHTRPMQSVRERLRLRYRNRSNGSCRSRRILAEPADDWLTGSRLTSAPMPRTRWSVNSDARHCRPPRRSSSSQFDRPDRLGSALTACARTRWRYVRPPVAIKFQSSPPIKCAGASALHRPPTCMRLAATMPTMPLRFFDAPR